MKNWLLLSATLPASPSGLRMRVWRALKATGAAPLREGVHLLPAGVATAPQLRALADTIRQSDADAWLLEVDARDAAQDAEFRALFDRSTDWARVVDAVREAQRLLAPAVAPADRQRAVRAVEQQARAVAALDFFPGAAGERAQAAVAGLRQASEALDSPGEPHAADGPLSLLDVACHQRRTWATRRRPWADRLATAWLVARFIDEQPTFTWLAAPCDCPPDALGFDFDGAAFTHVGDRVTFEVVATRFGLVDDPAIARLGALVRELDTGGLPVAEAAGVEAVLRGLRALHAEDDDALLRASMPVFDALHAALGLPDSDQHMP